MVPSRIPLNVSNLVARPRSRSESFSTVSRVALHDVLHASTPQSDNLTDLMVQAVGISNSFQAFGGTGIRVAERRETNAEHGIRTDFWIAYCQGCVPIPDLVIRFNEKPHVLTCRLEATQ